MSGAPEEVDAEPWDPSRAAAPPPEPPRLRVRMPERLFVKNALVAVNVAIFALMVLGGTSLTMPETEELVAWGANFGPFVAEGEYWRLLACAFLHVGLLHIVFNMVALRSLGIVEGLYGNGAFLAIYLLSALGASIASTLWRPIGVSAGASGAIFGLIGALLAFYLRHRRSMAPEVFSRLLKSLLGVIGINVMIGFIVPQIDNAAHLGGLATGFASALLLDRDVGESPRMGTRRFVRAALIAAALAAIALAIPARVAAALGS